MKSSNQKTKRPELQSIPMSQVSIGPAARIITMSPGQWDGLLQASYETGWTLLEIVDEQPVRAYRKPAHLNN